MHEGLAVAVKFLSAQIHLNLQTLGGGGGGGC